MLITESVLMVLNSIKANIEKSKYTSEKINCEFELIQNVAFDKCIAIVDKYINALERNDTIDESKLCGEGH